MILRSWLHFSVMCGLIWIYPILGATGPYSRYPFICLHTLKNSLILIGRCPKLWLVPIHKFSELLWIWLSCHWWPTGHLNRLQARITEMIRSVIHHTTCDTPLENIIMLLLWVSVTLTLSISKTWFLFYLYVDLRQLHFIFITHEVRVWDSWTLSFKIKANVCQQSDYILNYKATAFLFFFFLSISQFCPSCMHVKLGVGLHIRCSLLATNITSTPIQRVLGRDGFDTEKCKRVFSVVNKSI